MNKSLLSSLQNDSVPWSHPKLGSQEKAHRRGNWSEAFQESHTNDVLAISLHLQKLICKLVFKSEKKAWLLEGTHMD